MRATKSVPIKQDYLSLRHPLCTIRPSTKDKEVFNYEDQAGNQIRITYRDVEGECGRRPSMVDKGLYLYAFSLAVQRMDNKISSWSTVEFTLSDYVKWMRLAFDGRVKNKVKAALLNLCSSTVEFTLANGDYKVGQFISFGSIKNRDGQQWLQIKLGHFAEEQIKNSKILTLHPEYPTLNSWMKRLYEIVRQGAGDRLRKIPVTEINHRMGNSPTQLSKTRHKLKQLPSLLEYDLRLTHDDYLEVDPERRIGAKHAHTLKLVEAAERLMDDYGKLEGDIKSVKKVIDFASRRRGFFEKSV